jgi:hypothetical protein
MDRIGNCIGGGEIFGMRCGAGKSGASCLGVAEVAIHLVSGVASLVCFAAIDPSANYPTSVRVMTPVPEVSVLVVPRLTLVDPSAKNVGVDPPTCQVFPVRGCI